MRTIESTRRAAYRLVMVVGIGSALASTADASTQSQLCQQLAPAQKSVQVTTARLKVTLDAGVITRAENRLTGEHHTAFAADLRIPRGLGHVTGDVNAAAGAHVPWYIQPLPPCSGRCSYEKPMFHHPYLGSTMQVSSTPLACTVTYTGLSNGTTVFPAEVLRIDLETDAQGGGLRFRAQVTSPDSGVFGAIVPIANLWPENRIYIPSFGGTMFDRTGLADSQGPYPPTQATLLTLDRPPFWEAPVVAAEMGQGSLGLWIEDASFGPSTFFLSWTGSTFGLGIEQLNLMGPSREAPFPYTSFSSAWWHLDAFQGGWAAAMAPYRSWYAQQFATEIARRAAPAWAGDVRVVLDQYIQPCENAVCDYQCIDGEGDCATRIYDFVRAQLGDGSGQLRDRVLLYEPSARCDTFGTNLPRHEPRTVYPQRNRIMRNHGFRTMGYVNSYVVDFGSDGFNQHCVLQNGLPRRHESFWHISQPERHDFSNACPAQGPPSQVQCGPEPPPGCSPPPNAPCDCDPGGGCRFGEEMYLDALSPAWRKLHTHQMVDTLAHDGVDGWMKRTEFDAAYEDTAGGTGDFGNGGTLGGTLLFQSLQGAMEERLFRYPMATEWAPNTIAFAARWPLRANHMAGTPTFRSWLMSHQRPVSTFLFGPDHTAWTFTVYAMNNLHRHAVVAYSDALGGMAQVQATRFTYLADRGDLGHAWHRSRIFAQRGLKPSYDLARGPDSLAAVYTDRSGARHEYHATAQEQTLRDPAGVPLYSRITGVTRKATSLALLGWPAVSGGEVFGLDPAAHYNLTPQDPLPASDIRVTALSDGVKVRRYYEASSHAVLVLEALPNGPTHATVTLYRTVPMLRAILNDEVVAAPLDQPPGSTYVSLPLPARFVFVKQAGISVALDQPIGGPSDVGRFIEKETGIDRGGASVAWHQGIVAGNPAFHPGAGENAPHTFGWLVRVPEGGNTLVLKTCDGAVAGDGSAGVLYLNGREVARDTQQPVPNVQCADRIVALTAPVGAYAGREILIGIATDHGPDDNNVSDYRWFFRPMITSTSAGPAGTIGVGGSTQVP